MHRLPLAFAPVFDARAVHAVPFDRVRVLLVAQGAASAALDTTVAFASGADSVTLSLSVPVVGTSQSFVLTLALIDAAGDTVFRGGPVGVTALPGTLGVTPTLVPVYYTGIGYNAASVRFAPPLPGPSFFGDTSRFVAQALDTAGNPIPGTPIVYRIDARDTLLAGVPDPDSGRVVAKSLRGSARVVALLLTHQADTTTLLVQPRPTALVLRSGGGQTAAVGVALGLPVTVRANGPDGVGIQGVSVAFTVTAGGGSVSPPSATTDANGDAATTWTMGGAAAAQTMTASVGSVVSAPIGATATSTSASRLAFTVQPVTATAGAGLAAVQVAAQDAFGNLFPAFAGTVAVTLGANPGGATLTGTQSAAAVAGIATFSGLSLDRTGTGFTLVASASGLTSATSAGFTVLAGAAKSLALVSGGGQNATPGTQLAQPVAVKVADSLGNGVSGVSVTFAAATGGGSVGTPSATTNAQGQANTTWTLGAAAGPQTLTATATGLAGSPLTVSANLSGAASTVVTPHLDTLTALTATFQLAAQAKDALGNNVSGSFVWTSRAPAVATVSAAGLVTAIANGASWVVATEAGSSKDSAQIVVQQRIATVNVTPAARSIYLSRSYTLTAAAVDGKGFAMPGVTSFTWSTTAPAVATVDSTGLVTGVGLGTAQIRAAAGATTGVSNIAIITPITRIAVVVDTVGASKTDTFTLTSLGLTRRYRAIAHDTLDAVMSGVSFTWTSTNGSVASLLSFAGDTARVVSAANGLTQIQATAQGFTSTPGASLTVSQVLAAVALTPASVIISVGGNTGLLARGLDANGRYISGGSFTYTSSNPLVATVGATTGTVTGVALGIDTVTASSGAITSNVAIVSVANVGVPALISFGRDTVSVGRGGTAQIPVLLSTPPASALTVNLGLSPAAYAHWSAASVSIPAGQTSANATLVGDSAGTTKVIASDGSGLGYVPDTAIAKVTANMRLASSGYAINANDVVPTQVLLSDPSPAGGTYVTFSFGTPGIAAISPDPAFIPAGQLAADIQIRGLVGGTTTITPVAIGVNGTASNFTAYAPQLSFYRSIAVLGQGQYDAGSYVYTPTSGNLPLTVTLTSSDTTVVRVPAAVTIPAGTNYTYFAVGSVGLGNATISAAAPGWLPPAPMPVAVSSPDLGITGGTTLYTTSPLRNVTVYAEDSLRNAHYRINSLAVRLSSTDSTVMRVLDTLVTIGPGQYYTNSGRVTPGPSGGTAYIVATASGHAPDSTQFTVLGPPLAFYRAVTYLGAGQRDGNSYVYIPNSTAAPLVVTLTSSDSTVVSVPATVTIPANSNYIYFTAVGIAPGAVTVTATAPGFQSASTPFAVTSPAVYANGTITVNNFSAGNYLTVYATDSVGSAHYRTTPLAVSVAVLDSGVVVVDSSNVTIAAGQYYNNQAHYTPVGLGTARIVFSAAGHRTLDTVSITVVQPSVGIYSSSFTVGRRQRSGPSDYYVYTPNGRAVSVPVTLTQAHPSVDSLSTLAPVIASGNNYTYYTIFGLTSGADTVTATASGYLPASQSIRVTTPKFTTGGLPGSTTTTNPPITVYLYATDSLGSAHYTMDTVVVAVTSSDTTVIRPAQPFVRILRDTYYTTTAVNVIGPGSASITFTDSAGTGYLPVTTNTINVTGPSLTIYNPVTVLGMRQHGGPSSYYVATPNAVASALTVRLHSTDTRVATVTDSITITAGSNYAYFDVAAQDTVGTIQIQASASGYSGVVTNVQVTQPKFVLSSASQLNTTSPKANIYVYATDANGSSHYTNDSVTVTLVSSAPSVAAIDSTTVTIPAGAYYVNTATWSPGLVGTAQIQASDQRAAQYKYNTGTYNVAVVNPNLSFSWGTETLGIGQYIDNEYVATPNNTAAPIAVSFAHTGTARISTDSAGVPVGGVTIAAGTNYTHFRIVGTSVGTDTLVASAASPFHNPVTAYTAVGLGTLNSLGGWPSSLKAGDSTLVTLYARDPSGNPRYVAAATTFTLAPNANVQFVSGGVSSAVITSVVVPANAYYVQFYLKGVSAGTGGVDISATNYVTYSPTVTITP